MKIKFQKPTLYMSHSVRGNGDLTIEQNCKRAMRVASKIRSVFPEVAIYCPADHDLVLQILWYDKRIDVDDFMFADLKILRACSGWMWWWTSESRGCEEEYLEAVTLKMAEPTLCLNRSPQIIYQDLLKANFGVVRKVLSPIVEQAKKRFKLCQ